MTAAADVWKVQQKIPASKLMRPLLMKHKPEVLAKAGDDLVLMATVSTVFDALITAAEAVRWDMGWYEQDTHVLLAGRIPDCKSIHFTIGLL